MKICHGMNRFNKINFIKIIWNFIILINNQVYGVPCPENYVCADSTRYFLWTGKRTTMNEAERLCDSLGLLMLKLYNRGSVTVELMHANFTQVIQEDTRIWLGTKYDLIRKEYRWLETDELFDFDQPGSSAGDCLVATDNMTRIEPEDCGDMNHVVCMETSVYWYGDKERLMCHCRSRGCVSATGSCHFFAGGCALGWFGESCQLRDALLNVKHRLLDFNSGTCDQRSGEVAFLVSPPTYFSWIRIVAKEKVSKDMFSVVLTTSEETKPCPGAKSFIIAEDTVDIACCTDVSLVSRVLVKWSGVKTLCSVHMYRGQNVASQGVATVKSNSRVYNARFSVDGHRDILTPPAFSSPTRALDSWNLELSKERIVFEVIIYLLYALEMDVNVILELTSSMNETIARDNAGVSIFQQGTYRLRVLSGTKEKVKSVKIIFWPISGSRGNTLDLVEVEVYGACTPPSFSATCDVSCDTESETDLCHYDGKCDITRTTTTTTVTTPSTFTPTPVATPSTFAMASANTHQPSAMTSVPTPLATTGKSASATTTDPATRLTRAKPVEPVSEADNASTPAEGTPKRKRDRKKEDHSKYFFLLIPFIVMTLITFCILRQRNSHHEDLWKEDGDPSRKRESDDSLERNADQIEAEGSGVDVKSHHTSESSKHSSGNQPDQSSVDPGTHRTFGSSRNSMGNKSDAEKTEKSPISIS